MKVLAPSECIAAIAVVLAAGCTPVPSRISESRARAHVNMLAGEIGSRPIGTDANARARAYIMAQLVGFGFTTEVREAEARRPEIGQTARVRNIIAHRPGKRRDAVALVSHYDSAPNSPGAADAALGVAACLEAARVLAQRQDPAYSLMVLITDAEEISLMGAAALVRETDVIDRIAVFLNFEAIGSAGPGLLFEAGPGNGWVLQAWRRASPAPRGTSVATEIYRLLPNDTDFTILKRTGIPGLNFAPFGDSYPYHTPLDRPERLQGDTLAHTVTSAVAIVEDLDDLDLRQRSADAATFFDLAGAVAVVYGPTARQRIATAAIVLGLMAFIWASVSAWRAFGLLALLVTAVWVVIGLVLVTGAGIGATWILRATRAEVHPWYAHPERLFTLMLVAEIAAVWLVARVAAGAPPRLRATADERGIWAVLLPLWLILAALAGSRLPGASYLWTIPLGVAAACLLAGAGRRFRVRRRAARGASPAASDRRCIPGGGVAPRSNTGGILTPRALPAGRTAGLGATPDLHHGLLGAALTLAVAATLWVPMARDLIFFMVPMFGRLPIVTPVFVFAALQVAGLMMIGPPLGGVLLRWKPPGLAARAQGISLAVALVAAGAWAWAAPAYTDQRPLRRFVRYIQDDRTGQAFWEIGGNEPDVGLPTNGNGLTWAAVRDAPPIEAPVARFGYPFVVRSIAKPSGAAPASVSAVLAHTADRLDLAVLAFSRAPGVRVSLLTPPDLAPLAANVPGIRGPERSWLATYAAPPTQGVTFEASFRPADEAAVRQSSIIITTNALPGGSGWQGLPDWLPHNGVVWSGTAVYVLPLPLPRAVARPAALR